MKATTIKAVKFTLDKEEKETMAYAYDIIKKARDKVFTEHIDSVCEEDVFNIILDGKIDLYYDDEDKVKVREK